MQTSTDNLLDAREIHAVNSTFSSAKFNTVPIEKSFHTQLEMLALSVNASGAFIYDLIDKRSYRYGLSASYTHEQYLAFASYLHLKPSLLKVINNKVLDTAIPNNTHILTMLLVDANNFPLALMGAELVAKPSVKLSANQKRLASLIMENQQAELVQRQDNNTLQAIHSQHLQISALNQDHICIKDSAHKVVYANPAMLATFPVNVRGDILGRTTAKYYEPDTSAQIIDSDITALTLGYYKGTEHLTLASGAEKILSTTKKSFVGVDNKKYLMSVSRDITEKEILIHDLKRSNSDLDNFAYVASHDLRSPLNVIKRLVTWVKEDCDSVLPSESKEDLSIVLSRAERMEKLLVDLLSYSRIGKDYQDANEINLRRFMVELLSLIDLPMGFVLKCDDVDVKVPEIAFNVVMLNLVSNAIKHHDSGNAKIEVKAKRSERGCIIAVLDNGPGIEEKNRHRIFKLFETLKSRDEVEGSGIGLSVVKKIVEHYGGNIRVEGNQPRGTKFIVNWPFNNIARTVLDNLND